MIGVVLLCLWVTLSSSEYIVNTSYGLIEGEKSFLSDVVYYKGVPFAAPPVGDLRFRPPVPPTPWSGVKKTTVSQKKNKKQNLTAIRNMSTIVCSGMTTAV